MRAHPGGGGAETPPPPDFSRRRRSVVEGLESEEVDGFVVSSAANVRYLSGFTGSAGWLLVGPGEALLLTDSRYEEQADREAGDLPAAIATAGLASAAAEQLSRLGWREIGFEAEHLVYDVVERLRGAVGDRWLPLKGIVERLRRRKEPVEVDAIRRSLRLAESALRQVAGSLRPGCSERDVAAELEYACRRLGAEGMAFDTIVASGPRTALPHGVASQRRIEAGEAVMIDMGCRLDGYCSDITRMVWTDAQPQGEWRQLHELVARAQAAAIAAVRAGVAAVDVDAAARRVIEVAGYGEGFRHGTGHGVGIEVHEAPSVSSRSSDTLEAGMVLTIEPAVYHPERCGVRIEDMVCVDDDGCVRLTALGAEPILAGTPTD